jgi:hypothetical protein
MAGGRADEAWNHTSAVMAAVVNGNPFRCGKAAQPSDFHPNGKNARRAVRDTVTAAELGAMFAATSGRRK